MGFILVPILKSYGASSIGTISDSSVPVSADNAQSRALNILVIERSCVVVTAILIEGVVVEI